MRFSSLAIVKFLAVFALFSGDLDAESVGLAGARYGRYETTSFIRNLLSGEKIYSYVDGGAFLEPGDFKKYALVVLSHQFERPYTAEEHRQIGDYVKEGGRVLLIYTAPANLADDDSRAAFAEWSGFSTSQVTRPGMEPLRIDGESPLLEGVWEAGEEPPAWAGGGAMSVVPHGDDVAILIGRGAGAAIAAVRPYGKGKVYYAGVELFRLRQQPRGEKELNPKDSLSWIQYLKNILKESVTQDLAAIQQKELQAAGAGGDSFLIWSRPWQRREESGPLFVPAIPEESERVREVVAGMAVGETEAIQINLTELGEGGRVDWEWEPGSLPEGALELRMQGAPPPIPWPKEPEIARESPYWLMPMEAVEPKGERAFNLKQNETGILWLRLKTAGVAPGRYEAALRFSRGGRRLGEVAIDLQVHPVRVPERRLITLIPYGHTFGRVGPVEPAVRFMKNFRENGSQWTSVSSFDPATYTVAGSEEKLKPPVWRQLAEELRQGGRPELDASVMDPFMDASIANGLTRLLAGNPARTIDAAIRGARLQEEDAERVSQWALRQLSGYFKDWGYRHFYARYGDELSERELLEGFLPWAQRVERAGWKTTSSFTHLKHVNPELNGKIGPLVGCWTLNRQLAPVFSEALKAGKLRVAPGALFGTYGAGEGRGTEIRKNRDESRMIGWEAWLLGFDHCATNPYFKGWLYYVRYVQGDRGVAGERFIAYLDKDDLSAPMLNSVFLEGIRESMEEGNLGAVLNWSLDRLEKVGGEAAAQAAAIREKAAAIASGGEGSSFRWEPYAVHHGTSRRLVVAPGGYEKAKAVLLKLLGEVRPLALRHLKPSLKWNDMELIRDGAPVARVVGNLAEAARLNALAAALGTGVLPVSTDLSGPAGELLLLVGTPDDPALQPFLSGEAATQPKAVAPVSRATWIRDWRSADGRTILWIGAKNEADLANAVSRFGAFLLPLGTWFFED